MEQNLRNIKQNYHKLNVFFILLQQLLLKISKTLPLFGFLNRESLCGFSSFWFVSFSSRVSVEYKRMEELS